MNDEKAYEERADDIEYSDLERWTVESDFFKSIYKKIIQRGAKLIVGPRGSGKTHQMRFAYYRCLHDKKLPLAIYVSFNKYYYLEPFLYKTPNAIKIFHTWVLCKILLSCYHFLSDIGEPTENLFNDEILFKKETLEILLSQLEKSEFHDQHDELISTMTIYRIITTIENIQIKFGRNRTILLLDDAALNFTHDYLVEFFDIFRSLKATDIAPKASVYPGTTEYGPRFHISQDAEKVECWLNIEDEEYSRFMDELINKRLSENEMSVPGDIIELLKYAAFGLPRRFIGMIRDFTESKGATPQQKFTKVINEQKQFITDEYLSLSQKIPKYRNIIKTGFELYEKLIEIITKENKKSKGNTKQITIGLEEDNNLKLKRMLQFLIEAGLLYKLPNIRQGKVYERYVPHLLFLISERAFSEGSSFNANHIVEFIRKKSTRYPVRRSFESLLGEEAIKNLRLNLPPCDHCNAERLTEEQKFCHQCGKQLITQSAFDACMNIPIDDLPITKLQKDNIKKQTGLKTLGDILSAPDPATELRKADSIGKKRSEQIYKTLIYLKEEFLS